MKKSIDYENELNPQQLEAVLSTEGPCLVIAGAGSGKTRVLVYRTAYLVDKGIRPEHILLLTFTRRASREMLTRASSLLDDRCQKVSGGTFHSFAYLILRQYEHLLGFTRSFTVLDQSDAENAVNLIRSQNSLSKSEKRFPKKSALLSIISKSLNKGVDIEAVVYDEYPHFIQWVDTIEEIKDEYMRYKRAMCLMDYDDLLIYLNTLLKQNEEVCLKVTRKYKYIMVDEYQDTNKMQAQIIQSLTCEHQNVMVVGDDSQSIYSFRGAHFRNIIDFPKLYPKTKLILLEENYRSSQPILDLTNEVISSAQEKYEKVLFTKKKGNTRPVYVDTIDENSQSKYIINKIFDLKSKGVPLNEMAILFRSGFHSNDLEIELASHAIPFVKYGGQKFVEAAHIKDILSYLRILQNPFDEISWLRVLLLMKGVGAKTASDIIGQIIYEHKIYDIDATFFKKNENIKQLFALLKKMDFKHQSLDEILEVFLGFYYPFLMDHYDDYDKRINDLDSLKNIASRYESLEPFLADMALDPPEKSIIEAGRSFYHENNLTLSTIHSAKGLEWNTVFLLFVAEGYLPSYRSFDSEDAIEEERRLFYVATTRAKDNLFLLRPQMDNSAKSAYSSQGSIFTKASRFLGERDILKKMVTIESNYSHSLSD